MTSPAAPSTASSPASSTDCPSPGTPPAFWAFDPRRHARSLYWRGWGISQIADEFALQGLSELIKRVAFLNGYAVDSLEAHYERPTQ